MMFVLCCPASVINSVAAVAAVKDKRRKQKLTTAEDKKEQQNAAVELLHASAEALANAEENGDADGVNSIATLEARAKTVLLPRACCIVSPVTREGERDSRSSR